MTFDILKFFKYKYSLKQFFFYPEKIIIIIIINDYAKLLHTLFMSFFSLQVFSVLPLYHFIAPQKYQNEFNVFLIH